MAAATSRSVDDPLTAALVAAAELAKNGGAAAFLSNHVATDPALMAAAAAELTERFIAKPASTLTEKFMAASAAAASHPQASALTHTAISPSIVALLMASGSSRQASKVVAAATKQHQSGSEDEEDHDNSDEDDNDQFQDSEEDNAERRIARCRARNREHAKRTRLRKKAQLEALQSKVKCLQAESKLLKQSLEECSIASILVGLSSGEHDATIQSLVKEATDIENKEILKAVIGGKRKRFLSDVISKSQSNSSSSSTGRVLEMEINGRMTKIGGGGTHINWKTGAYTDEDRVQHQLSYQQLETLRRERNRMHAKMTRDRKKSFIATIQQTIGELESSNKRMKATLSDVVQSHFTTTSLQATGPIAAPVGVTPNTSPAVAPKSASTVHVPLLAPPLLSAYATLQPTTSPVGKDSSRSMPKRITHGFSLKV